MKIILNVTERKPLATLLGEYKNIKPLYLKAPSYGYQIGDFFLTREGNIEGPEDMSQTELDDLLNILAASGYIPERTEFQSTEKPNDTGLTITLPLDNVNVENLTNLLKAKGTLIRQSLQIQDLHFELCEDSIAFSWFSQLPEPDEVKAYTNFIVAICKMSKVQKRISAKEKQIENPRYTFRCFLLRLGFIGDEYKADRKILLQNLQGSSAFKGGAKHDISE